MYNLPPSPTHPPHPPPPGRTTHQSTDHHELKLTAAPKTPEGKIEPDVVGQVFIAQQATSTPGVVSLKTPFGRFVSADKFGIVSANREAVGPQVSGCPFKAALTPASDDKQEEWTVILREDGVAFQSQFDKFLAFEDERNTLRADSESVGFAETFLVKCQVTIVLSLVFYFIPLRLLCSLNEDKIARKSKRTNRRRMQRISSWRQCASPSVLCFSSRINIKSFY